MTRAVRVCWVLVGVGVAVVPEAFAQQPAGAHTARVTGQVIDERTREPLEGVRLLLVLPPLRDALPEPDVRRIESDEQVRAHLPPGALPDRSRAVHLRATTNATGMFEFPRLEPGRYRLLATRHGYLQQWLTGDHQPSIRDGVMTLGDGQHAANVRLAMSAGGAIRGRLVDPDGLPAPRALVSAVAVSVDVTGASPSFAGTTDHTGAYWISGLPPGLYMLAARTIRTRRDETRNYRETYYPGVTDQTEAAGLRVSIGEVLDAVDIMLVPEVGHTISGTVRRHSSDGAIDLQLRSASSLDVITVSGEGTFRFESGRSMSGPHLLIATAPTADGTEVAVQRLDLAGERTEALVRLEAGSVISGQVVALDGTPLTEQTVRVAAVLELDGYPLHPLGRDQVVVDSSARFVIDGVIGERRLEVYGLPPEWEIDRVLVAGTAVRTITVGSGQHIVDVRVVLRRR